MPSWSHSFWMLSAQLQLSCSFLTHSMLTPYRKLSHPLFSSSSSVTLFLSSTCPLLSTLPTPPSLHSCCAPGSAAQQPCTTLRMPPRAQTAVQHCIPHLPAWQTGAGLCSTLHRQAQIRASHDLKSRKEINQTPSGQFGILQ